MKTLNDIQEAHKNWEHDDISDENGIRALFEQVVGITELLESKACPSNISWKCRFVDPNSGPSDADIEARKTKKDDERRVAFKAQPTRVEYVGTYAPQTEQEVKAIERAAMITVLRWWCSDCRKGGAGGCEYCKMRDAFTRLENGGEL